MNAQPFISDATADAELHDDPHATTRMSIGEHLEELRRCLIRALSGIAIGTMLGFIFGDTVMGILIQPLLMVQRANGLQPQLQALTPTSTFSVYLKVAFLVGLIVAMPWVFQQFWRFVAAGLYPRERQFVRRLVWPSVGLFTLGVMFQYFVVLPIVMQFFVTFNRAFELPNLKPAGFQSLLLPTQENVPAPPQTPPQKIPMVREEPTQAEPGELAYNESTGRLMMKTQSGWTSVAMEPGTLGAMIQSQFALDSYVSFVLLLALAFGLTFETPVVVYFLARTGLVTTEAMAASRRYIVLGMIIVSAILTPTPDMLNQLLLAGPMYLLFELGLFAARIRDKKAANGA